MSMSNRERVAKGMEQVRGALIPFVEREMWAKLGDQGFEQAIATLEVKRAKDGSGWHWDNPALFRCFFDHWQEVFKSQLGQTEKNYIGELRDIRNRWAHDDPFGNREAERALGRIPERVDHIDGLGYDIQSRLPGGGYVFIEVKGLALDTDEVVLTASEIKAASNYPNGGGSPSCPWTATRPFRTPTFRTSTSVSLARAR